MTEQQINQMFEGRWRIKGTNLCKDPYLFEQIKTLCRDFFTAGIMIAEKATVPEVSTSGNCMVTVKEGINYTKELRFDTWWKLYDLKVGKDTCFKKWVKLSLDEIDACIAATPAYVAATPDKQFRKRPLTYLNQKAWNDEIIFRNGTDKQQQQRDRLAEVANRIAEYAKDAK
jgi:hypothetical protein